MRLILTTLVLAFTLFGCVRKGYVPHYIVTDSLEPAEPSSKIDENAQKSQSDEL